MEEYLRAAGPHRHLSIVILGHVDHGKSTIIGRLLADTGSLPIGKLEQVKETCRRNARPFEYAFLLDALKDEQAQGITIDSARCFFKTKQRKYTIIDAPGHTEFLKNMISGASRAEAALIVIDALEGIRENSKRHGYLLSMLGIRQVAVLVNKMDLVGYDIGLFLGIADEYKAFLQKLEIEPLAVIPVSGVAGDNIAGLSEKMPWYRGETVLEALDRFVAEDLPEDKPFRMPVQGVYKFTRDGDNRRIIAGTVESGRLRVGDEIVFYPSGKKSRVKSIEAFNCEKPTQVTAGYATGFIMTEEIYVKRGEIACLGGQTTPKITTRMKVSLFWLGKKPMTRDQKYYLKLGSAKIRAELEEIIKIIDASNMETKAGECIGRHEVAECILKLEKEIAFDLPGDLITTSRFVIVDEYEISGGGIIQDALEDKQSWVRDKVLVRNTKWEQSEITELERVERLNQKSVLVLITGPKNTGKKAVAKALEKRLFAEGKLVYFLGIGNVLYGVDADIKTPAGSHREEHLRRLAEVAHILLDTGMILLVTAVELTREDLETIKTVVKAERIQVIWVGETVTTDIEFDLWLDDVSVEKGVNRIKSLLQDKNFIYKPW